MCATAQQSPLIVLEEMSDPSLSFTAVRALDQYNRPVNEGTAGEEGEEGEALLMSRWRGAGFRRWRARDDGGCGIGDGSRAGMTSLVPYLEAGMADRRRSGCTGLTRDEKGRSV